MTATLKTTTTQRKPGWIRLLLIFVMGIAFFAGLTTIGLRARAMQQSQRDEADQSHQPSITRVLIVKADRGPQYVEQVLPGSAVANLETAVYARTSGYLRRRLVDIGDVVKADQLLAEIETPEIDAQLSQARATLNETKATLERNKTNEALAKLNFDRVQGLIRTNAASQQEFDGLDAALKVATATVHVTDATIVANEAAVKRLVDLQSFQKITAPYAGVVTARNYDPGALIVADSSAARELFHISQIDSLRVYADVPQMFSTSIREGQSVSVYRRETPGREQPGTVSRTTQSLNPQTRTLRVEVDVPNQQRVLLPGMYLQVRFRLNSPTDVVRVPGAAVITRAEGTRVAVVDQNNILHYRSVKLGRDFGTTIEIISGLKDGENVIVRPGDDLPEGVAVEPVTNKQ